MGWFSRKKKNKSEPAAPAPPTHDDDGDDEAAGGAGADAEAAALIGRWDASLAQFRADFDAVLGEARAGSEPLIEATQLDLTPLTLPWNTIEARRHELGDEVSDAWDEISDEMSECDGVSHDMMSREGSKRDATITELEISYLRAYGEVMARAADKMRAVALAADAAEHACQACGAPLDQVRPVSTALNVECGHCNAMNTVEPGNALRMFAAMGALPLAERAAFDERVAMMRAEHQMHQYRDNKHVPLALLQEFERASIAYFNTRLQTEASYDPAQTQYVESKLARHTKDAHKTLKQYWQWRQHLAAG